VPAPASGGARGARPASASAASPSPRNSNLSASSSARVYMSKPIGHPRRPSSASASPQQQQQLSVEDFLREANVLLDRAETTVEQTRRLAIEEVRRTTPRKHVRPASAVVSRTPRTTTNNKASSPATAPHPPSPPTNAPLPNLDVPPTIVTTELTPRTKAWLQRRRRKGLHASKRLAQRAESDLRWIQDSAHRLRSAQKAHELSMKEIGRSMRHAKRVAYEGLSEELKAARPEPGFMRANRKGRSSALRPVSSFNPRTLASRSAGNGDDEEEGKDGEDDEGFSSGSDSRSEVAFK